MESAENHFTAQFVIKNFKNFTEEQYSKALSDPELAKPLLSGIPRLSDSQLLKVAPHLHLDQIDRVIPSLQLQQTGTLVQKMTPEQIRRTIKSLTHDDQMLLAENITLLTCSATKEELQNILSFIDPLAMSVAIKNNELRVRLIEACGVMTLDQLKVIVPLLSSQEIRDILIVLEEDNQIQTTISMIDNRDQFLELLKNDFSLHNDSTEQIKSRLKKLNNQIKELDTVTENLQTGSNKELEISSILRRVKNTKVDVESLQQSTRQVAAVVKIPFKFVQTETESSELLKLYSELRNSIQIITRELREHFFKLDSLLQSLNKISQSTEIMKRVGSVTDMSGEDSLFIDEDQSIQLYEAVRQIGNPDAIGNFYQITWNDIISAGFRSSQDFANKQITNLEQLVQFIQNKKQ